MTQRGDPGWNYLVWTQTATAGIVTVGGFAILLADPASVWVGVPLVALGTGALGLLAVVRRRGRY